MLAQKTDFDAKVDTCLYLMPRVCRAICPHIAIKVTISEK